MLGAIPWCLEREVLVVPHRGRGPLWLPLGPPTPHCKQGSAGQKWVSFCCQISSCPALIAGRKRGEAPDTGCRSQTNSSSTAVQLSGSCKCRIRGE